MARIHLAFVLALTVLIAGYGSSYSSSPSTPSPTPAPAPAPAAATTVTIPSNARTLGAGAYSPNPATVAQGSVVTWSNTDSTTHDMVADNGTFDSGRVGPNGTYSFTFAQKGSYTYHCSIHPSMTGTIVVQ